jgi:hypothetical protein
MSCGCSETPCLLSYVYQCNYLLNGTFKKCSDDTVYTASLSSSGRGPTCYKANIVAERNLNNTLAKFLKCNRSTIINQTITKNCFKKYF